MIALVDGLLAWSHSLQGQAGFQTGLRALAEAFGAAAIAVTKVPRDDLSSLRSVCEDLREGNRSPVSRSFAAHVIGSYLGQARAASVWSGSMAPYTEASSLMVLQGRHGLRETVVVVLDRDERWVHLLELHFESALAADTLGMINSLGPTLSRTWQRRAAGLFTEALLERSRSAQDSGRCAASILSDENPAGLSRAEFRVCLLLSNGLNKDRVRAELKITPSTLRTHMRQICTKTGYDDQQELIHQLLLMHHRPGLAMQQARLAGGGIA